MEQSIMDSIRANYPLETSWFAVWTRSRQEKTAASTLGTLGVEHLLPLKAELHRWSDRNQVVTAPLFPGYLFVRLNPLSESRFRVLNTPGIAGLVGNQAGPLPIPDEEIENIHRVLATKLQTSSYEFLSVGERVRVTRGALAGIEGKLVRSNADSKLVISVEMIRQSIALSIHASDVEPLQPPSRQSGLSIATALSLA
jgi:transcription antitermination factor NusG